MSWYEISSTITAYQNRLKLKANMDYKLADLIGVSAARMMSAEVSMPAVEEAYPFTMSPEQRRLKERQKQARTKDYLMRFTQAHNAQRKG